MIKHIVQDAARLGGKPHIAGTRMSVQQISILHKSPEWSIESIAEEFSLTYAQIHAVLAYYYDNQDAIDKQIKADDELSKQVAKPISDLRASSEE